MASANEIDTNLKCPICVDVYKNPRKLTGCSHSFCENCILTFVLNLRKDDAVKHEFLCPVCRLPTAVKEDEDITIEWVRKMATDEELVSKIKRETIEMSDNLCSLCKYLKKSSVSTLYCINCLEYFCASCSETLHAYKLNRDHTVIEVNDINKSDKLHAPALKLLVQFIFCASHSEIPVKLFCELHDDLVCSVCAVLKHADCPSVKELKEISNSKLQEETEALVSESEKLIDHMKLIVRIYRENETENSRDLESIRSQVQEMKQKIIQLMDVLEDNINQESGALAKNINLKRLDEIDRLNNMIQELNVCIYLLKTCLTNASASHVFICVQKVKRIFQTIERKNVQTGKSFVNTGIQVELMKLLNDLLCMGPNETPKLAAVREKTTTVSIPVYREATSRRNYKIEKKTSIVVKLKESKYEPTYNDLLYLPDNRALLVDSYEGYCCLVDDQFKEIISRKYVSKEDSTRSSVYMKMLQYASCMENGLIAISLSTDQKICFVTQTDLRVKGEISCDRTPKALCAIGNDEIAISWEAPVSFSIISQHGGSYTETTYISKDLSDFSKCKLPNVTSN